MKKIIKRIIGKKHKKPLLDEVIVKPCFRIGDKVHHNGRNMDTEIISLYDPPEPIGTPCKFYADIKFNDGAIWISQDATFNPNINGNSTICLLNTV